MIKRDPSTAQYIPACLTHSYKTQGFNPTARTYTNGAGQLITHECAGVTCCMQPYCLTIEQALLGLCWP
jgi:hypothetical protein